jgi:hypothetical protein
MASNYPTSLDSLQNPSSGDSLVGHAQQHSDANDAIEAIQLKLGIDGSSDTDSIEYRLSNLESDSGTEIIDKLGLSGNNVLEVTGIEMKTTIDTFSMSAFRSAKYSIQLTKNQQYYSSIVSLIHDGTNVYMTESDIISNTENNLGNIDFEINSGIINLTVTPISSVVSVRFIRTAIKA